jgi:hypothetical protein
MRNIFLYTFLLTVFLSSCNSVNNKVTVSVENGLNINSVEIQYGFYSGNEESDKKLVENGLAKTVFENNQSKTFNTICGENDFLITYENKYYAKVRHFIPNDFDDGIPDEHKYNFEIKNIENGLLLTLCIIGIDGKTITKKFAEIKNADNNKQGEKIKYNILD